MRNDDDTLTSLDDTTEAESFAQVENAVPLVVAGFPLYSTIGLNAVDPSARSTSRPLLGDGRAMTKTEVCFSFRAGDIPESEEARAPVDIIVALDTSGSMCSSHKLELCKTTLIVLLRQLLPQDRFGLISYHSTAEISVPLQRVTSNHKAEAMKKILSLQADGGTNMSAAVGLSAQEMRTIQEPNPVQTVFLLTDGHANEGISDLDGLVRLVRNCFVDRDFTSSVPQQSVPTAPDFFCSFSLRCASPPSQIPNSIEQVPPREAPTSLLESTILHKISLHTFGYGSDHNSALLRDMASATEGGSYYFIEQDKDVGTAFGNALGGVLTVVAQSATLTLDVPAEAKEMGVEIQQVHHDKCIHRENGSYTVTVGDFYAEETRDLVVTVKLAVPPPSATNKAPIPHVIANLSYTDTIKSCLVWGESAVISIARPTGTQLSEENDHVAAQCFRVYATKKMEEAEKMVSIGRFDQARGIFGEIKVEYGKCPGAVQSMPMATELASDAGMLEKLLDREDCEEDCEGDCDEDSDEDSDEECGRTSAILSSTVQSHKMQRAKDTSSKAYAIGKKRVNYAAKFS